MLSQRLVPSVEVLSQHGCPEGSAKRSLPLRPVGRAARGFICPDAPLLERRSFAGKGDKPQNARKTNER